MVAHGENGFIVAPHDLQLFAGYMRKFVDDPGLAERFGSRSRELMAPYTPRRAAEVLAGVALAVSARRVPVASRVENPAFTENN